MIRILRKNAICLLLMVVFQIGCKTIPQDQINSDNIMFPYELIGNIDKINFREPSGICWHAERKTLFVVGDEGDVCEIKSNGTLIKQKRIRPDDFEGITYDPASGFLYIAVEGAESIIELDPDTFAIKREFSIPRLYNDKTVMKAGGQGIEAITFIPDSSHAEGGVFYVANQSFKLDNDKDISAIFTVELPLKNKDEESKLLNCFKPGVTDLAGLYYDAELEYIYVVSDANNIIMEYKKDFNMIRKYAFPCENQEGITVDDEGFMYVAQDSGGIVKLKLLNR